MGASRPGRRPWFILAALILALTPLAAPVGAAPAASVSAQTLVRQSGHTGASTATTPVTATYTNPIYASIPMSTGVNEDCPDPSIMQGQTAGDTDWYAYCTSGPLNNNDRDSTGHLVIHRIKMLSSHDLVNWTYRGDVLGKSTDNPSTRPSWLTSDNTWAPDIRYFNNQYYLYYTGPDTPNGSAIFVVTSTTPLGPWTADPNPVVEPEAPPHCCNATDRRWTFDSALVTDDTISPTRTYIFYGSFYGGLSARLLSADGLTSSVSETQVMTGRAPLADIAIANRYEGAYVVKHGGYFYLFASATNCCNGALTSYGVFVGRSVHALGPYTDREGNSFLSGRVGGDPVVLPKGNSLVGIGHNAVFTDEGGQDWYVSHALQRANPIFTDAGGGTPPRRPFVMDPLDWGADGWPVVRGGFGASDTPQPAPVAQPGQVSAYTPVFAQPEQPGAQYANLSDEFNGNALGSQWTFVRGDPSVPLSYTVSSGSFNMDTQPADLQPQGTNPPKAASVLTEPTPAGDYIVDTKVHLNLPPEGCCQNYVQAGLVIYGDNSNYVKLVHVSIYETRQTEFGKHDSTGYGNGVDGTPSDDTYLRIVKTTNSSTGEELYRAYTSQDGIHFVRGGVWTHTLGSNARIGLVSMGGSGYTANFDYVHVYQVAGESGSPTPTGCGAQTVAASATVSGTQTVSPTTTMTGTQTGTTTATQTTTPAASSTATAMASSTATSMATGTATTTATCTPAPTRTGTSTAIATSTSAPTNTATNTATSTPTNTAVNTPTTTAVPATTTGTATSAPATPSGTPTAAASATGTAPSGSPTPSPVCQLFVVPVLSTVPRGGTQSLLLDAAPHARLTVTVKARYPATATLYTDSSLADPNNFGGFDLKGTRVRAGYQYAFRIEQSGLALLTFAIPDDARQGTVAVGVTAQESCGLFRTLATFQVRGTTSQGTSNAGEADGIATTLAVALPRGAQITAGAARLARRGVIRLVARGHGAASRHTLLLTYHPRRQVHVKGASSHSRAKNAAARLRVRKH